MIYKYVPKKDGIFATYLRRDGVSHNLTWENTQGKSVLIVQCEYGKNPIDFMSKICEELNIRDWKIDTFVEVLPSVWVRKMTPLQKIRNSGCQLNGEASTYAVFCIEEEGDTCFIYAPQSEKKARIDIPSEIEIVVEQEKRLKTTGTLFWKKEEMVNTGFYIVKFNMTEIDGYKNGSLVYETDKIEIPITKKMIEKGSIYLKTNKYPRFITKNSGLKIKE